MVHSHLREELSRDHGCNAVTVSEPVKHQVSIVCRTTSPVMTRSGDQPTIHKGDLQRSCMHCNKYCDCKPAQSIPIHSRFCSPSPVPFSTPHWVLPPSAVLTTTMSECRGKVNTAAQGGNTTATAVVLAIGQRVQDFMSMYMVSAKLNQRQPVHQKPPSCQSPPSISPHALAVGLDRNAGAGFVGLTGAQSSGAAGIEENCHVSSLELNAYSLRMNEVRLAVMRCNKAVM